MIEEKKYYSDQEKGWCAWFGETLPLYRHWRATFCNKQCNNAYFNSDEAAPSVMPGPETRKA